MQQLQPNTTLQGGKYRIERVLGQGGFGITYAGYNTEFEETVAIKEFFMKGVTERDETTSFVSVSNSENTPQFEEQREKFKKEARRLRRFKNIHIVRVHDLFEENGTAYYVMDYIDGESLAERMKRCGSSLTESLTLDVMKQILEALREVHSDFIWHLDLKPGNIMMDKDGVAYLIDFGASKQIRANGNMTTSTTLCFTPGYAPNEQVGQMYDRFGPWTDIYALGATMYSLLTNEKPPMSIDIEDEEDDAFDFPSSVSDSTKRLIMWMMQPNRKKRPQNVNEITSRLGGNGVASQNSRTAQSKAFASEETIIVGGPKRKTEFTHEENEAYIGTKEGKAVNLGLSVLWADCNVGTSAELPAGGLYGWGDPTGELTSADSLDYMVFQSVNDISGSKYDIATSMWGGAWRMPSRENWLELIEKCQWVRTERYGLDGFLVIGPNRNHIFLPVTGIRFKTEITNTDAGYYWTSNINPYNRTQAYYYYFKDIHEQEVITRNDICTGRAVRPVHGM